MRGDEKGCTCGRLDCGPRCDFQPTPDDTAAPDYYVEGREYEPHRVISDWKLNFNLGSVVKYIARFGRKEDDLKDLRKARQFLDFEIARLESE